MQVCTLKCIQNYVEVPAYCNLHLKVSTTVSAVEGVLPLSLTHDNVHWVPKLSLISGFLPICLGKLWYQLTWHQCSCSVLSHRDYTHCWHYILHTASTLKADYDTLNFHTVVFRITPPCYSLAHWYKCFRETNNLHLLCPNLPIKLQYDVTTQKSQCEF